MSLQLVRPSFPENRRIAPRLRIIQHHGFLKEFKPINLIDSAGSRVDAIEYDERLALRFQIRLCDDLNDGAIFREDLVEGFL